MLSGRPAEFGPEFVSVFGRTTFPMFGSALKSNMVDSAYEYGRGFYPHFFRRWAPQEKKVDDANDAQIKGA